MNMIKSVLTVAIFVVTAQVSAMTVIVHTPSFPTQDSTDNESVKK